MPDNNKINITIHYIMVHIIYTLHFIVYIFKKIYNILALAITIV